MEGVGIAIITPICLAAGKALKASPLNSKWIPLICMALGMSLGVAGYFSVPEIYSSGLLGALLIGTSAGGMATGIHQTGKGLHEDDAGKDGDQK